MCQQAICPARSPCLILAAALLPDRLLTCTASTAAGAAQCQCPDGNNAVCTLQVSSKALSDQQWLHQAHMLGRHWQRTSCSASGNPVPNTHFPQEDRGGSESDDSADVYETDNQDKVQPSKSTSPPVRKVMQAMAMPKRAKAIKQATLVDIGVAQAPVSTALRRAESQRAAEATSKSSAASGAPAYKGIGEYSRRLKEAGKSPSCYASSCLADR